MHAAIVIPARLGSTRLPEKPLLRQTGKYLVQHVYERAAAARLARRVIVATDDQRIVDAVRSFGGEVVLTRADHASGTDRVAEVAAGLREEIVLNVQGDEPLIEPRDIDSLIELMRQPGTEMGTLAVPMASLEDYASPTVVKVVCDDAGRALYFSRSPIPHARNGVPDLSLLLQHLGIYAFRREFLLRIPQLPPHPLERMEQLEQLRVLASGGAIHVGRASQVSRGIDTPQDYAEFVELWNSMQQDLRAAA